MSSKLLQQVAKLARKGDIVSAYELAHQITLREPGNFQAWMWLAYVAQSAHDKRAALRRALELKPEDASVRESLMRLNSPRHIQRAAMSGVFMSYARADELFALELIDSLRANGIEAWMDMTEISPDSTWDSSVARALKQSGLMLLVLSPEAMASGEVQSERSWFLQTGKIVLPVLHKTCHFAHLNLLSPGADFRQDYALGLRHLLKLLHGETDTGPTA